MSEKSCKISTIVWGVLAVGGVLAMLYVFISNGGDLGRIRESYVNGNVPTRSALVKQLQSLPENPVDVKSKEGEAAAAAGPIRLRGSESGTRNP